MSKDRKLRIAISGTYSTGKTTTTEAVSLWLGIPRTHAQTMREILPRRSPVKRSKSARRRSCSSSASCASRSVRFARAASRVASSRTVRRSTVSGTARRG